MTHNRIQDAVSAACDRFLASPTKSNQDAINQAADAYRDSWIESQAHSEAPPPATLIRGSTEPPTTYDERHRTTERLINEVPVHLALQQRTSARDATTYWVLSWRAKLSKTGPNRRFYLSDGKYWSLPVDAALEIVDEIAKLGCLAEQFFDQRVRNFTPRVHCSTEMSETDQSEWLARILAPGEQWGSNPFFVALSDPNDRWWKVMIINPETRVVTFRSITNDTDYMPKKILRPESEWFLDNSMMDANVQQMRVFREQLQNWRQSR